MSSCGGRICNCNGRKGRIGNGNRVRFESRRRRQRSGWTLYKRHTPRLDFQWNMNKITLTVNILFHFFEMYFFHFFENAYCEHTNVSFLFIFSGLNNGASSRTAPKFYFYKVEHSQIQTNDSIFIQNRHNTMKLN